jgi:hypothetical protein
LRIHQYKYLNKLGNLRWIALLFGAFLLAWNWSERVSGPTPLQWNIQFLPILLALVLMLPNFWLETLRWKVAKNIFGGKNRGFIPNWREVMAGQFISFVSPGRMGQFLGRIAFEKGAKEKQKLLKASLLCSAMNTFCLVGLGLLSSIGPNAFQLGMLLPIAKKQSKQHVTLFGLTLLRILVFATQWFILIPNIPFQRVFQFLGSLTVVGWGPIGNLFIRENLALFLFPEIETSTVLSASVLLWCINLLFPALFGLYYLIRHFDWSFRNRLSRAVDLDSAKA